MDTQTSFSVSEKQARTKLLESIPSARTDAVFRLIDAGLQRMGLEPDSTVRSQSVKCSSVSVTLPKTATKVAQGLVQELRRPFSLDSVTSLLAKAIFRGIGMGATVTIPGEHTFTEPVYVQLKSSQLEIPDSLAEVRHFSFMPATSLPSYSDYRKKGLRKLLRSLDSPERVLPLESLASNVSGYFDYRAKPFTAIRSYFECPGDGGLDRFQVDLWEGPYSKPDSRTLLLEKKQPGKFLFLRWRANYGQPTFLHHNLNSDLDYGLRRCKATFWVNTSESPAAVWFLDNRLLSDPVAVEGPPGLSGVVVWPGLTHDLWGTSLVRNEAFEEALAWTQTQVDDTARCLRTHLDEVVDRVRSSDLLTRSYAAEVVDRMTALWG